MEGWITFWKIVLVGGLGAFFILAIIIAIGGASNIKDFLSDLSKGGNE